MGRAESRAAWERALGEAGFRDADDRLAYGLLVPILWYEAEVKTGEDRVCRSSRIGGFGEWLRSTA